MITFSLQSGSNGNAIYVEANGVQLLFDAGISGIKAEQRMKSQGRDIRDVDALIISHDHNDHVRCAGIYQRKYGMPMYITRKTLDAAQRWRDLGALTDLRHFRSGETLKFDSVSVHTHPTAHDAVDGVGFVVECEGKKLGILTDLGHCFFGLADIVESVDAAYLECNYDPAMLAQGSYPPHLKARIRGPGGHLSNGDSASILRTCKKRRPNWIVVSHLSEQNNHPELAMETQRAAVGRDYPVYLAPRHDSSQIFSV